MKDEKNKNHIACTLLPLLVYFIDRRSKNVCNIILYEQTRVHFWAKGALSLAIFVRLGVIVIFCDPFLVFGSLKGLF